VVICNFTPIERAPYRLALPRAGAWAEVLNTDAAIYGGANRGNLGVIDARPEPLRDQPAQADIVLPALSAIMLRHTGP
jgi:1,4-alpha-glucan branching enzyme